MTEITKMLHKDHQALTPQLHLSVIIQDHYNEIKKPGGKQRFQVGILVPDMKAPKGAAAAAAAPGTLPRFDLDNDEHREYIAHGFNDKRCKRMAKDGCQASLPLRIPPGRVSNCGLRGLFVDDKSNIYLYPPKITAARRLIHLKAKEFPFFLLRACHGHSNKMCSSI